MSTQEKASRRLFYSDSVKVGFYPHVFVQAVENQTEEQKVMEFKQSYLNKSTMPIMEFMGLGANYLDQLQEIWAAPDKKTRQDLKRRYLGVGTISGIFSTRNSRTPLEKKIEQYNSLIVLDFDDVEDVEAGKQAIGALPYVWYCALSASRKGFFAVVPLDTDKFTEHEDYYYALEWTMTNMGYTIDGNCKDVTRLRYVSYDPSPIIHEGCEYFTWPEGFDLEAYKASKRKSSAPAENPKLQKARAYADEWEKKQVKLDDYSDWLSIAMALTSLGEDGWEILDRVSQGGKGYDQEGNRKKYDELLRNTRSTGLGTFFYKCQEYGVIPPSVPHYELVPFPVEVFPKDVQEIIRESHRCLNYIVDHISSSMLFAASIAVGNSVMVEIKSEWVDKAILYVAIVGKPGSNKSAPLRYAMRPLNMIDKKALQKYEKEYAAYEEIMSKPLKERKNTPEEPEYKQIVLSDFTTEVLIRQHKINPRGLAVYVDELIGFIKCFNKYRSGNDEEMWTQLYNGGSVIVNRMSSRPLNIENTCIGVIGTIQPGLLGEFAKGKTESGFVDRWLFAYPDDSAYPTLNQAQMPRELTERWKTIIEKIHKFPYKEDSKPLRLTKDAMAVYTDWFNALAAQKNVSSPHFAEMATKMERYCIRFSIVLEALKCACSGKPIKSIGVSSIKGGIDLCYYYMGCSLKARKRFNCNPLDELNEKQRRIYNELPISFPTSEAIEVASTHGMSERTLKDWLKSNFFKHISHGQYEKRYK